jgi:DNA-binding transcriptional regulator of glucitol operon
MMKELSEGMIIGVIAVAILLPFAWRQLSGFQRGLAMLVTIPILIVLLIAIYV